MFARQSESWADRDQGEITYKGGVAFIEAKPAASILVRSYRVTVQQFKDVFWQENSCNLRIENVDLSIDVGSSSEIGRGWYAQIIRLPDIAGEPAFTFTDPTVSDQPHRAPSRSYLRTIIRGMVETFRLEEEADLIDYLRKCPGLATDQAACNDIPRIFAEERAVAR